MSATALGLHFVVTIDGEYPLGAWTKCEGLVVEYDVYEYREGGVNDHVHRLPGRAKYQNVKLTRPVTSDTAEVARWLAKVAPRMLRTTANIAVRDATGTQVASWSLQGVYPVRWTGPTLDVAQNQVATETLELAHDGFLAPGQQ